MTRIGVLRNAGSRGNLGRAPAPPPPGAILREAAGAAALEATLAEFRAARIAALLIDGGDGTVRETLSRLPEVFAGRPPPVALAPRGNTNLIAREVGGWRGADAAARLIAALERGAARETARPVLRVERAGERRLRGFILGLGAYAQATELARRESGARGPAQVALAVAATLRRLLFGGAGLREGAAARLVGPGAPEREGRRLLTLVTALQGRLTLGLNPFWGEGEGTLRWLDVLAPGERLAWAAPRVALGRPARWMAAAGYASGRAARLTLETEAPFVLDGETFDSEPAGRLDLAAEDGLRFLSPGR